MNRVVASFPDNDVRVALDHFNTHGQNESWLKTHPNAQCHFTPTRSSWLKPGGDLTRPRLTPTRRALAVAPVAGEQELW